MRLYALSIKQPWATLVVHGRKTIEIRRWSTPRRGLLLIHAARVPDPRTEGWRHVSPELQEVANLRGGILGAAILSECRTYRTQAAFDREQDQHLNASDWFELPALFGLVLERPIPLAFHPCTGNVRFFTVGDLPEDYLPEGWRPENEPPPETAKP